MIELIVLFPVYNDWSALRLLLQQLETNLEQLDKVHFIAVNDCSSETIEGESLKNISIINLNRNVGHQKAIAIGLSYISDHYKNARVVVMDSDGEDKPEDLNTLLKFSYSNPGKIVFAKRTKRVEVLWFRIFYKIYKFIFSCLTGKSIAFGNYCIIPPPLVSKVTFVSEIWNHFSGGIIKSKLPYLEVPLERGQRLNGKSKMNFTSLVLHGLSAISVHIDTVAVRLVIATISLVAVSLMAITAVILIKFFTNLATPGWATTIIIGLLAIIINAFFLSLLLVFIILSYRAQKLFIPAIHYKDFIEQVLLYEADRKRL